MRFALVLGGGGIAGIAWETGLLHGLRERGIDLGAAELIVGTSAGSVVGAQIATGNDLGALYARQAAPLEPELAAAPVADLGALLRTFASRPPPTGPLTPEQCAQVGQLALAQQTEPEEARLRAIAARLPVREWPERRLLITAVDAADGRFVTWDRASGVSLLEAVASSCAVPLVYPPVTIDGRRYIDGGIRSTTNADVAAGYPLVVIVAPGAGVPASRRVLEGEMAALRAGGSTVVAIWPDAAALGAFGPNVLDPATRSQSAEAGLAQADAASEQLRDQFGAA